MKTLMIVGHPSISGVSVTNKIIVEKATEEGFEIRNIAELYPDFKIDIEAEQKALLKADVIILQFPFYWYSVPGILKQWMDVVLSHGFAFGSTGDKLSGKKLILSFTIGGPEESYKPEGNNKFEISQLIFPLVQLSNLTRMTLLEPVYSHGMIYIPGVYNVKEVVEEKARDHWITLKTAVSEIKE